MGFVRSVSGTDSGASIPDGSITDVKVGDGAAINLNKTADSGSRMAMTSAERTKLAGIAPGAVAYTDEQAQDAAAPLFTGGVHTGIGFAYDDVLGRLNATVTGGSASPTAHPTIANAWTFGATQATPATAPGAPTVTGVAAGAGQVTVSFSPPASNGGAAITSYTATSTPGGFTASAPVSPIVVTGLTNGTSYTFKVKATNSAGTGPESAATASATPAASGAGTVTTGTSTPATWWIPFGGAPHCRVTWQTGVVSGQCRVVWVASMPDVRARTSKLETGVAAQDQAAYQAYIQDLSTGLTVADSGIVLGTANTWTATNFTPVAGRRYKGFARVRSADGQFSPYSGTRFVAPTGVTLFFEDFGMAGDNGVTRNSTDIANSLFENTSPFRSLIKAANPGDLLKSKFPGTTLTGINVSGASLTAGSSVFTAGMVGKKVTIYGAGSINSSTNSNCHRTTITAQTGTGATLAAAAPTAVTGTKIVVGPAEYWMEKVNIDPGAAIAGGWTLDGTGCEFFSTRADDAGFRISTPTDLTFLNVHWQTRGSFTRGNGLNNNTCPFFVEQPSTVGGRLIGCYSEHARDAGILIYGGPTDWHIVDCVTDHCMADSFHVTATAADIQFIRPKSIYCGDDAFANIGYRADGDAQRPLRITWESPTMIGQDWGRGVSFGGCKDCIITDVSISNGSMAAFIVGSDGDMANTENVQIRRFTVTNPKTRVGLKPIYTQGSGTGSTVTDDAPMKLINSGSPVRQRDFLFENGTMVNPDFAVQILSFGGGEFQDGTIIMRSIALTGLVNGGNPGTGWLDQNTYPNHLDFRGFTVPAPSAIPPAPTAANS